MMIVGKTNQHPLTGWSAVSAMMALAVTKALTALVVSFPITWLVRQIFAGAPLGFVFGADRLSYWRCVGLFAIWNVARIRIKFSRPAQIKIEGDL